MSQTITTSYHTVERTGAGRITAKGGGKQRTVSVDLSKSSDWNHGNAAGTLIVALTASNMPGSTADEIHAELARIAALPIDHDSNDSGTKHKFVLND